MTTKKRPVRTKTPVDGTKYYHYREHFVRTGSLRSFDLMMRHYEVAGMMDLFPAGQSRFEGICYSGHNEDIKTKGSCDRCEDLGCSFMGQLIVP